MGTHRRNFEDIKDAYKKFKLIEESGHHCWECKMTEWMGSAIPLTLDHIDGNSDNGKRENLRILCPNCHALTPTYTGKNKGTYSTGSKRNRQAVARIIRQNINGK